MAGIAAAIGLTIAGGIDRMSRLAREMARTDLLVVLSEQLTPEHLDKIVQVLLGARTKKRKS